MAADTPATSDIDINTDVIVVETFGLIWLDNDVNAKDTRDTEQKLRSIVNRLKKFEDVKQCQKYIEERPSQDRLIMIANGPLGQEIVPYIHQCRQLISIYVYCKNKISNMAWIEKFPKIKAVLAESDELISRIRADHKLQKVVEEPLSINFFTPGASTSGINGQFVFSQALIDCLLRLKPTDADKNELIKLCRKAYEGNNFELNNILKFEQDYKPDKVLWWYTRESFFYKTLNAILRNENIHMMFLFRGYIADMERQLRYHQTDDLLKVYRGQLMLNDERKKLEQRCGQFISVNSFFSTSNNDKQARSFLYSSSAAVNLDPVLFEIDADPKMATTKPFADVSKHSDFPGESEILFVPGSIFRLISVTSSSDGKIWIIRMSLCSDNEHSLKQVLMYMKQQVVGNGDTTLRTLGKVLWKMGKLDLAEQYFIRLLKELSPYDPLQCELYEDLGELAGQAGDYDKSVEWHQKSLALKNSFRAATVSSNKLVSNSMGKFNRMRATVLPYEIVFEHLVEERRSQNATISSIM